MKRAIVFALLMPFLGLSACKHLSTATGGYTVTEYAPDGSVEKVWKAQTVKLEPGRVSWTLPDGTPKSVTGSYKVVRGS